MLSARVVACQVFAPAMIDVILISASKYKIICLHPTPFAFATETAVNGAGLSVKVAEIKLLLISDSAREGVAAKN